MSTLRISFLLRIYCTFVIVRKNYILIFIRIISTSNSPKIRRWNNKHICMYVYTSTDCLQAITPEDGNNWGKREIESNKNGLSLLSRLKFIGTRCFAMEIYIYICTLFTYSNIKNINSACSACHRLGIYACITTLYCVSCKFRK